MLMFRPRLWLCVVSLLISSCGLLSPKPSGLNRYSADIAFVVSGAPLLGREVTESELPNDHLGDLTPAMVAFAEAIKQEASSPFDRAELLHRRLLGPSVAGGKNIQYNAYLTEAPAQTFDHGRANCLSYTLLYVALAKSIGLAAYVNEVDIPPSWDSRGKDSVFYLRHVNAKVKLPSRPFSSGLADDVVIDLEMSRYRPTFPQRALAQDVVEAQYYSNRAAEILAEGPATKGFLYLRKALSANDQQAYIWNNLANLYRANNFLAEAEIAYLYGLSLNKRDLTIMHNLAGLYVRMGEHNRANYFRNKAQKYRAMNPYHKFTLAQELLDKGEPQAALPHIRRALRDVDNDPRFYALASAIYQALNNTDEAAAMLMKSQRLEAESPFKGQNANMEALRISTPLPVTSPP